MAALHHILSTLAGERSAMIVAATDADGAGRRHAARLEELAVKVRVCFAEILPPGGLKTGMTPCARSSAAPIVVANTS
jgi:hypothetical protein